MKPEIAAKETKADSSGMAGQGVYTVVVTAAGIPLLPQTQKCHWPYSERNTSAVTKVFFNNFCFATGMRLHFPFEQQTQSLRFGQ